MAEASRLSQHFLDRKAFIDGCPTFHAANMTENALRVLVISHTSISRAAGQSRLVPLLAQKDVELRLLVPDRWKEYGTWKHAEPAADARLHLIVQRVAWPWTGPGQWYLHWYPRLGYLLREFRPEVIHLWEEPWGLVSVQAALLRNRMLPEARLIFETEQNISKKLPFPFERFRTLALVNSDLMVARNSEAVSVLREKGYRGATAIIPYGIDPEIFRPMERSCVRRDHGFSGFVLGYVGRLVEEKGLTDVLGALSKLPSHINLVIVGAGPMRGALINMAHSLHINERVRFMIPREPNELATLMNGMDALVLASRTTKRWKEQFGRVLIEAQACGLPLIGSDSGAIPQVIGDAGLVVPERAPDALAKAIKRLDDAPQLRGQLAENGRAQVAAKYTWKLVAEQLLSLYRSVHRSPESHEAVRGTTGKSSAEPDSRRAADVVGDG